MPDRKLRFAGTIPVDGELPPAGAEVTVTIRAVVRGHTTTARDERLEDVARLVADELVTLDTHVDRADGQLALTEPPAGHAYVTSSTAHPRPLRDADTGERVNVPPDAGQPDADPPAASGDTADEPPPDRHPQIAAEAWDELNLAQRREVADLVDNIERFQRGVDEAKTPTDRDHYGKSLKLYVGMLRDEFGIELLHPDDVDRQEAEAIAGGDVPPPVAECRDVEQLRARRRYLAGRVGLPAELAAERDRELEEINDRLRSVQA